MQLQTFIEDEEVADGCCHQIQESTTDVRDDIQTDELSESVILGPARWIEVRSEEIMIRKL